ncbi:hypothetical protein ACFL2R_01515 [Patescibacteria group bacterium]
MSEDPLLRRINLRGRKKTLAVGVFLTLAIVSAFYLSGINTASGAQKNDTGNVDSNELNLITFPISSNQSEGNFSSEVDTDFTEVINDYYGLEANKEKREFENKLYEMVGDHPIKEMVPYIAEYDQEIAALIIGIGKKESNWGKRSPLKDNGETCYNYWGYRGAGSEGIAMGHGCFGTPKEAVDVIGGRIERLSEQGLNTPSEMIVWKCGSSCAGHAPGSADKWISDVSIYYDKIITF